MWAICRVDLGLLEEEIGALTLREFDVLLKRQRVRQNHERLNAGIVAAMIWNCAPFASEGREPKSPLDFVPDWKPKELDMRELTPYQQKIYLMNTFMKRKLG